MSEAKITVKGLSAEGPIFRGPVITYRYYAADISVAPPDVCAEYLASMFPVPTLRTTTKRGKLRWKGKMRTHNAMRRFYGLKPLGREVARHLEEGR